MLPSPMCSTLRPSLTPQNLSQKSNTIYCHTSVKISFALDPLLELRRKYFNASMQFSGIAQYFQIILHRAVTSPTSLLHRKPWSISCLQDGGWQTSIGFSQGHLFVSIWYRIQRFKHFVGGQVMKYWFLVCPLTGFPSLLLSILLLGTAKNEPRKRDPLNKRKILPDSQFLWSETQASHALNSASINIQPDMKWRQCKLVVAKSQDKCTVGSWIFASSPLAARYLFYA